MPEVPRVPAACGRSADRRIDLRLPYPPAAVSYLLLAASFGLHPQSERLPGAHRRPVATKPSLHDSVLAAGQRLMGRYPAPHGCPVPADDGDPPGHRPPTRGEPARLFTARNLTWSSIPKGWRPRRSLADRLRLCSGRLTAGMHSLTGWRITSAE